MTKKDDATQTGVSANEDGAGNENEESGAARERPKSPRELGMELMVTRRHEQLEKEGVSLEKPAGDGAADDGAGAAAAGDDDVDVQIGAHTEEETAATNTSVATDTGAAEEVFAGDPSKIKVKVKVDGKEQLVPLAQITAQYQKGGAADNRLAEATRTLEEAKRVLEEAKTQKSEATSAKEKKAADEAVEAAKADLDAKKNKYLDSMYEGDKESARALFDEIIDESVKSVLKGRGEAATLDEAAIIARVTPAVQQSLEVKSALKTFKTDFPKIANDPYLAKRADAFLNEEVAGGKPYDEAFKAAGEKTLGWMRDTLGIKSDVIASTTVSERAGKKGEIDNPPSANKKSAGDEPVAQQDVGSTIAKMRAARPPG